MGLVVPVGFVAVFTGWRWVAAIAAALLDWSRSIVEWHARMEPNWRIPSPPLWVALGLSAALLALALVPSRMRFRKAAAAGAVFAFLLLLLWHPFAPATERNRLEMTAIDVGQGDSILLALPEGRLVLVDGGGIPTFGKGGGTQLDIGEDVVSPYLWSRSIRQIDVLVCTHAHEDHIGGLVALLRNFHVKELWTGATPVSARWEALRKAALANGVRIVPMESGRRFAFGGARFEALAPVAGYIPGPSPRNNDSLALRVSFGKNAFLLSGDIERQVEEQLAFGGSLEHVDVLKVAHHGSRTSSIPAFLDAARPEFAVISAGAGNFYGHPHPEVIERFQERNTGLFRTDEDGLVSIVSDGYRLRVNTWRWEARRGPLAALSLAF